MNRLLAIRTAVASALLLVAGAASAADLQIIGIQPRHSSVLLRFSPVPGALDYRVYDVLNPNDVKYAGRTHRTAGSGCTGVAAYDQRPPIGGVVQTSCYQHMLMNPDGTIHVPFASTEVSYPYGATGGPTGYDGPDFEIEWNGAGDGKEHQLVVEAVNMLGPVVKCNLYVETDLKAFKPLCDSVMVGMPGMANMLGGNKGKTEDGKVSTNGQGPYTNNPQVIAKSLPFTVQANRNLTPIIPGATQVFMDTFEDAQAASITAIPGDCANYSNERDVVGGREWTMKASGGGSWRIIGREINCDVTMPFIASNHYMDVLGDNANQIYGSLSMTPDQTFDISGGRILHLTQEVDDFMFGDRWMDMNIAPASDPLVHWNHQDRSLNRGNQWLFMMNFGQYSQFNAQLLVSNGPAGDINAPGNGLDPVWSGGVGELYDPRSLAGNGLGLDNKRRWDFFLSTDWAALFIDGRLVQQGPLKRAEWLSQPLKVYFSHYVYHSELGWKEMLTDNRGFPPGYCNLPLFSYWYNDPIYGVTAKQPITALDGGKRVVKDGMGLNTCEHDTKPGFGYRDTDERHWDNMGASVLPAGTGGVTATDFSKFAALVQPPLTVKVGTPTPPVVVPPPPVPVDCVVSAWGPDTLISTSTNVDGSKTQNWIRSRTITTQPANGGAACPALGESWSVSIAAPPAPSLIVQHVADDRPVYALTKAGAVSSSTISGIRIAGGTPAGPRIGTGAYCDVSGKLDTKGKKIARGAAVCGPQ